MMKKVSKLIGLTTLFALASCSNPNAMANNPGNFSDNPNNPYTENNTPSDEPTGEDTDIDDVDVNIPTGGESSSEEDPGEEDGLIVCDGASATSTNTSKVSISDGLITITGDKNKTYVLRGNFQGRIYIDSASGADKETTLLLDGFSITTTSGDSPICNVGSATLKIKANEGSVNYIYDKRDASKFASDYKYNAAVYSSKKVSFVGKGEVNIDASACYNGIKSGTHVKIKNETINVVAYNNAIKADKEIQFGDTSVDAETSGISYVEGGVYGFKSLHGNCIKSSDDSSDNEEVINYYAGEGNFVAAEDGLECDQDVNIYGGKIQIVTGGGSSTSPSSSDSTSYKGIKSDTNVNLYGGELIVDSKDDAVHSNGNVNVSGGSFTLSSGDDGVHADDTVTVSGGVISVLKSYEGIEGETINMNGGTTYVKSSDDGLNAAGGNDSSSSWGWGSSSTGTLNINDGYLFVNADGDGLDSNGALNVNGGVTVVAGPTNSGNGPLDYGDNSTMTQNGGTIIAYGAKGMAVGATAGSQYSMLMTANSTASAGSYYILTDGSGNVVAITKIYKSSSSFYFSSPSLTANTYSLYTLTSLPDSVTVDEVFKQYYTSSSTYSGGSAVATATLSTSNMHVSNGGGNQPGGGGNQPGGGGHHYW